MTARTPHDPVARLTLWAGIGMTCCFVAASAMLISGLAEHRTGTLADVPPAGTFAAIHR